MELDELLEKTKHIVEKPGELAKLVVEVSSIINRFDNIRFRPPGFYEIVDYDELYVLGDLHGDLDTLVYFLEKTKIIEKMQDSDTKLVFLGDYVDRGIQQIELIALVLLLKKVLSSKIVLLRGNHEPPPILLPYPHDFPEALYIRYGEASRILYGLFLQLFQRMGYGARVEDKLLLLHGGPPSRVLKSKSFEEAFGIGTPCLDDGILEEILWNDPIEFSEEPLTSSPRGAGYLFSVEVTLKTLELARVKYIVRGHEAVEGYRISHDGKLITLFDSKIPSYGISRAGYIHIKRDDPINDIHSYIHVF